MFGRGSKTTVSLWLPLGLNKCAQTWVRGSGGPIFWGVAGYVSARQYMQN